MSLFPWALGTSDRKQAVAGEKVAPVQHACSNEKYSRTGKTYRAVCGRQVHMRNGAFDPKHERACADCVKLAL